MNPTHCLRQTYLAKAHEYQSNYHRKISLDDNYDETLKTMSEMIVAIKTLLQKTNQVKQLFDSQKENIISVHEEMRTFKEYLSSIQQQFQTNRNLDQKMAGPFTFRLSKELNYWRFVLPFCLQIIRSIESTFEQQKFTNDYSIYTIYFLAVNKIDAETTKIFRVLFTKYSEKSHKGEKSRKNIEVKRIEVEEEKKLVEEQHHQKQIHEQRHVKRSKTEKKVTQIIELYQQKQIAQQKAVSKKKQMVDEMHRAINSIYHGLNIRTIEPLVQYFCDISQDENAEILYKDQKTRNNKIRKDLKEFTTTYNQYLLRTRFRFSNSSSMSIRHNRSNQKFSKDVSFSRDDKQKMVTFFKSEFSALKTKTNYNADSKTTSVSRASSKSKGKGKNIRSLSHDHKSNKKIKTKEDIVKPLRRLLVDTYTKKHLKIIR